MFFIRCFFLLSSFLDIYQWARTIWCVEQVGSKLLLRVLCLMRSSDSGKWAHRLTNQECRRLSIISATLRRQEACSCGQSEIRIEVNDVKNSE